MDRVYGMIDLAGNLCQGVFSLTQPYSGTNTSQSDKLTENQQLCVKVCILGERNEAHKGTTCHVVATM